ncbi:glycosyltransferase [Halobacillus salinus]|uniref:Glycosyltransferase n=1 Tax=Halobacillus salinus TaxID=192814 RepID=A0A4Z0GTA8_9BACI|nr:glycosyltransferase [Halobacillus salinus]TGB00741.1 glycosyltransferase [Halobacillus salinus]
MKVSIVTLGSRGDVQPYVALGKALLKNGHEVSICTGETFKRFIESNGIAFYPATADLMELLESEEGREVFNGGARKVFQMMKYSKQVVAPAYRKSMDDFLEASRGADLIIYHPKALGAVDIASFLGIPCVCMPPVPIMYPITEFPNLAVAAERNLGPFFNRLTYKVVPFTEKPFMKEINDFRNTSLSLPKRKAGTLTYEVDGRDIPIVYPISPYLFEDVTSWNDRVFLTGFFYLDIEDEQLDEELESFLQKGKKPVVISFSSMPLKDPVAFKEKLLRSLEKTGDRAVILTGTSGLEFNESEGILAVEKAPHRLLFQRAKGIVHHGGVGTMAEALFSGVPQLVMPFNVDQPFWAHRLYQKGITPKPLREKEASDSDLATVFRAMEDERLIRQAQEAKAKIEKEDGLAAAVSYLERLI